MWMALVEQGVTHICEKMMYEDPGHSKGGVTPSKERVWYMDISRILAVARGGGVVWGLDLGANREATFQLRIQRKGWHEHIRNCNPPARKDPAPRFPIRAVKRQKGSCRSQVETSAGSP